MKRLWDSLFGSVGQMPPKMSTTAAEVDWLYDYIYWWCVFFFILIVAVMIYFMWRYRRRAGHSAQPSPSHHLGVELIWSVIPTILIVPIFYWGFTGFVELQVPPADCMKIEAKAYQWSWKFYHPNGADMGNKQSEQAPHYYGLHIPPNRNVQLIMSSDNVLHSFYVPNFRIKNDVVPGRYTSVWFNAPFVDPESPDFTPWPANAPTEVSTKNGRYKVNAHRLFCTEYCGTGHSTMDGWVFVHESMEAYEAFVTEANNLWDKESLAKVGAELYGKNCISCHNLSSGSTATAPLFGRLSENWGQEVTVIDGATNAPTKVKVDRDYVIRSILAPGEQLALQDSGSAYGNNMQKGLHATLEAEAYAGTEKEAFVGKNGLDAIVAFIESLKNEKKGE